MATVDQIYKASENESTFMYEGKLPSLPVPDLEPTLAKYLESTRPYLTDEQFNHTKDLTEKFKAGDGAKLQELLVAKGKRERNWLSQWWYEHAYLNVREALTPFQNMGGSRVDLNTWAELDGSRTERTAMLIYIYSKFWKLIREEKLKPNVNKGVPLAMDQFKRLFSTVRIPGRDQDKLECHFKTESEGHAPEHIAILLNGHIFELRVAQNGQLISPQQLKKALDMIEVKSTQPGQQVAALTTAERNKWADNREHLISISKNNAHNLQRIESAMYIVSMTDDQPKTGQELLFASLGNEAYNYWSDKLTLFCFRNGLFGSSNDHTPVDGLCTATLGDFIYRSIDEVDGQMEKLSLPEMGDTNDHEVCQPNELIFTVDDQLKMEIERAKITLKEIISNLRVVAQTYEGYGKGILKVHRYHPEAFVQIVLQSAYVKLHGKAGSTYTTATTRKFYEGRTETCRACTAESVAFARAIFDDNISGPALRELLKSALDKFNSNMQEACDGRGCDRHLLGLYLTAIEHGFEVDELFKDPAYSLSGGGGNFVLSTSCIGYWKVFGGIPPMISNGYAMFYAIEEDEITFSILDFISNEETDSVKLYNAIVEVLNQIKRKIFDEPVLSQNGSSAHNGKVSS